MPTTTPDGAPTPDPVPTTTAPPVVYENRRSRRRREAEAEAAEVRPTAPEVVPLGIPATGPPPLPLGGPHDPEESLPDEHGWLHAASLPFGAALLLAWALTTLVGDVGWGPLGILPMGLASLSPLVLVPALVVITVALRRRSWTAVVPAAVAAALPWAFVVGYVVPASVPAGRTVPLRALLVTAHNGAADAAEIATAARDQAADVVVVTELSPALAHDLTRAGLARRLPPRYVSVPEQAAPAAGLAIYSRFPVEDVQTLPGTLWPAVRARVVLGGSAVTLVAGHTVQPSAGDLDVWRSDLRAFGAAARIKGPVLVLANLNATPWHPQFRWMVSGRLHDSADVLGRGLRPTWPGWSPVPLLPTDHALVAGLGVTSLGTVMIAGTDHRALSVEVAVPQPPP
jgi:endonuclease/exonuclease/phosphatase (EEP) superfamily protein YafD